MIVHLRSGRQVRSTPWTSWAPEFIAPMATILISISQATDIKFPALVGELTEQVGTVIVRMAEVEYIELSAEEERLIDEHLEKARLDRIAATKQQAPGGSGDE